MAICPAADRVVTLLPQESHVSQLSPNRVREDFDLDVDTMDVFPVFPVSPRTDGYFPSVSPVSSPSALSTPGSSAAPGPGSLLNKATGPFDSTVGSRREPGYVNH